jgi:hypothetical protein
VNLGRKNASLLFATFPGFVFLGKKIVCKHNGSKKGIFRTCSVRGRYNRSPRALRVPEKTVPLFECFPHVCPEPVLVK